MTQQQRSESGGFGLGQHPMGMEDVGSASGHVSHPVAPMPALTGVDPAVPDISRGPRILLVEDDPDTRTCMSALLELEGYFVVTAGDGREALQRLRDGLRPGLIVLDLMMPGMDGFEFRREQLRDPGLSSIPVAVYSGHHDATANAALLKPVAYIQKPINFDSFLDMVSTYCGHVPAPVGVV